MIKPRKLIKFRDLKEKYGLPWSRRHLDRLEAAGQFPKRVRLSKFLVAWVDDEVAADVARRIAARDTDITV